jgi:hypothetical protein
LYSSPYIIKEIETYFMRWAWHVAHMDVIRKAFAVSVDKPDGKRPLGRHGRRCKYNITIDLGATGWDSMGWILLTQDRDQWWALVNTIMNIWVS